MSVDSEGAFFVDVCVAWWFVSGGFIYGSWVGWTYRIVTSTGNAETYWIVVSMGVDRVFDMRLTIMRTDRKTVSSMRGGKRK